jgi:hypothetical protein
LFKVFLLWVEVGLTNGAMVIVTNIVFKDSESAPVDQPRAVTVRMKDYPIFLACLEMWQLTSLYRLA